MSSVAVNGERNGRKKGPSLLDVARLAGVSGQTVSRVSNQPEAVKPETRERVLRAMDQLGYAPNRAARALRHGSYGSIGLLARQFDRTGESAITDAVLRAAALRDLSVTLMSLHAVPHDDWEAAARRMRHQTVDGLILLRSEGYSTARLALPPGLPMVASDSRVRGLHPCVVSDEVDGVRKAVDHLLALGHRTVHHLAGPEASQPARLRLHGWRTRLEEAGITPVEPHHGDWTPESGYRIGRILAAQDDVTAVLCGNDEMAFGLMKALREAGKDVPGDVSVIGFDGIALGEFAAPALTTIRQDFARLGTELLNALLALIEDARHPGATNLLVPTELVLRGSTAPPRA